MMDPDKLRGKRGKVRREEKEERGERDRETNRMIIVKFHPTPPRFFKW